MNQSDLRKYHLQQRNGFSQAYQSSASTHICEQIICSQEYQTAKTIAAYLAIGKEIDLALLIKQAWQDNKQICLPRLSQHGMNFALYEKNNTLIKNKYGIAEPDAIQECMSVEQLDLIYLPLVAFDKASNRIGMGGGYYDRALAKVSHIKQPMRIGVAYKEQETENCFSNKWDIPLHKVITNND